MMLRVLIADDEPLARERLRFLLAADKEVEVAAECRNGREVTEALRAGRLDALFLDIEMPGRSVFETLGQADAGRKPPLVFITAHPRYAVQAFNVQAIDYLTKPLEALRLHDSLRRVRENIAARRALLTQEQLKSVLLSPEQPPCASREGYRTRLLVPGNGRSCFVNVKDIEWIEAADYYSCLHTGSRSLMLRETIKSLAGLLDPGQFVRIHRSFIVNVSQIREMDHDGVVILHSGRRLRMSKRGSEALLAAVSR